MQFSKLLQQLETGRLSDSFLDNKSKEDYMDIFHTADGEGNFFLHHIVINFPKNPRLLPLVLPKLTPNEINLQNKKKQTPLFLATQLSFGSVIATQHLIEHGADVNIADHKGNTPVLFICQTNQRDKVALMEILIKNGADVNVKNNEGKNLGSNRTSRRLVASSLMYSQPPLGPPSNAPPVSTNLNPPFSHSNSSMGSLPKMAPKTKSTSWGSLSSLFFRKSEPRLDEFEEQVVLREVLWIKEGNILKNWNVYLFVLTNSNLHCYQNQKETLLKTYTIKHSTVSYEDKTHPSFRFYVQIGSKALHFQALNKLSKSNWINTINQVASKMEILKSKEDLIRKETSQQNRGQVSISSDTSINNNSVPSSKNNSHNSNNGSIPSCFNSDKTDKSVGKECDNFESLMEKNPQEYLQKTAESYEYDSEENEEEEEEESEYSSDEEYPNVSTRLGALATSIRHTMQE